ncbi:hypothetical protein NDJ00_11525 [Vibrio parahaemolyticus]|uniref:hypothetical protein n=1 Tax=Vibrio parahaemolyticus TaxID=670 RepID=UPI0021606E2D|nr:hypothetical protein [Vibrio parahaemolyticus]MCS0114799.1 hypothetical protein [Vibrio parahaemolyticus]
MNERLNRDVLQIASTLRIEENECINIATITYLRLLQLGYSPSLVTGSLECNGKSIYPFPSNFTVLDLISLNDFTGHLWVECDEYIIDIAIMFTIKKTLDLQRFLYLENVEINNIWFLARIADLGGRNQLSYKKKYTILDLDFIETLRLGALSWLSGNP